MVDRMTFEAIRDIPGKVIADDIRFSRRQALAPALVAEGIAIGNDSGISLVLNITYNPRIGSKTFNVHVPGVGPICRLDVDGPAHRPAGRSHKHSLQTERCPGRNLPDRVVDGPDLAGSTVAAVFSEFCRMANIEHSGEFGSPDEEDEL